MEEFWKRFDQIATEIGKFAPQAYERLLIYKQAESIAYLVIGFFCVLISLGLCRLGYVLFKKADHGDEGLFALGVFSYIFGGIFVLAAMLNLLYVWNWIGAFVPDARLVHDVFESLKPNG